MVPLYSFLLLYVKRFHVSITIKSNFAQFSGKSTKSKLLIFQNQVKKDELFVFSLADVKK